MLHQLWCNILDNNCESIDLFKKLGFSEIGIKNDWIKTDDGYLSEHMYQLIKEE
jgi:diamine N-acetyltransferase